MAAPAATPIPASYVPAYQTQPIIGQQQFVYSQPAVIQTVAPVSVPAPGPVYTVGCAPMGTYTNVQTASLAATDRFQQMSFTPQYATAQAYQAVSLQPLTEEDFRNVPFNQKLWKMTIGGKEAPKAAPKKAEKKPEEKKEEPAAAPAQPEAQPQPVYYGGAQPVYYGGAQPVYYGAPPQ